MKKLLTLIALSACTAAAPSLPPQAQDTCDAANYADLIGKDATALEQTLLLGMVRVIRPGEMVTQDFRPERINFIIDDNETVQAINCG